MPDTTPNKCDFCIKKIKGSEPIFEFNKKILNELPWKNKKGENIEFKRSFYDQGGVVAILAPEQFVKGHTLVIPKQHINGITDTQADSEILRNFIQAINKVSQMLEKGLPDIFSKMKVEKVIVCMLCESKGGHLHAHLLPRYDVDFGTGFQYLSYIGSRQRNYCEPKGQEAEVTAKELKFITNKLKKWKII